MKKILYSLLVFGLVFGSVLSIGVSSAEAKSRSVKSYSTKIKKAPSYKTGGQLKVQKGYFKKSGTYVQPHFKTGPDQYKWNNRKAKYGF